MNTIERRKEMLDIGDNLLTALHCVNSYKCLCVAEGYVHDYAVAYGDLEGASERVTVMKQVLECRRRIVRRHDVPRQFDPRYREEGR